MGILTPILFVLICLTSLFSSSYSVFPRRPSHPYKPPKAHINSIYETKYFTQNLDHFDYTPESYKTFQQRYLINSKEWGGAKKGSPIFVYIGHQDDITFIAGTMGFMIEITKIFQSMLVFIEHRYYGESVPFGGQKAAYKNSSTLGYLNSRQALADVATLVTSLKKNQTALESPVVVFGGGYGGMLAAWFRLKYPHVALGALASSAPVLDFDNLVSPYSFTDIITKNIKSVSQNCYTVIKKSWAEMEKIIASKGGIEKIAKSFKLCNPLPSKRDFKDKLFGFLELSFIYASFSDYPIETNIHIPLPAFPVKKMCKAIDNPRAGHDTLSRLYGAVNVYYNYTGEAKCFDLNYKDNGSHGTTGWQWQACTELVEPTIKNNEDSIFPPTYKHQHNVIDLKCRKNIKPRPHWLTTEFGGNDMKRVLKRFGSNIIFFNGQRNPISGGGVLESISKRIIAIVAPEGAHDVDLLFPQENDPKWLDNVRKKEINIIEDWLEEYNNDDNAA